MPSRDENGKQLSGAALRKRAKQKRAALGAMLAEMGCGPSGADFAPLPPPPVGKSEQAILWAFNALVVALSQVTRDPLLTDHERWQWMERLGKTIGMLSDKAQAQQKIKLHMDGLSTHRKPGCPGALEGRQPSRENALAAVGRSLIKNGAVLETRHQARNCHSRSLELVTFSR